jgi:dimethylargininase
MQIVAPATLEGGDVLKVGRKLFVGLSSRTNMDGARQLEKFARPYGYHVVPVEVHGCLHLKTGITALDDRTLLINPNWIDAAPFGEHELIHIAPEEQWAANLLRLGSRILMNAASPKTLARVRERGFDVTTVDISEFMKMEAGLTCMSLLFE